jgi:hypothetical protein
VRKTSVEDVAIAMKRLVLSNTQLGI